MTRIFKSPFTAIKIHTLTFIIKIKVQNNLEYKSAIISCMLSASWVGLSNRTNSNLERVLQRDI